ncbi:MAG: protein translocase SEC61 complex subunit gamma [Methanocorpusculum sp.]|jgi:protein transport protein SEC61 subunit gamma-like protein|uniref:protein translocase SEC61 complex subunit gamma n=1 Tax=Methanocorpusculum sp. TaxID=2058474 RepID=UPI002715798C|nr:protein translocase SEC61 complex subunit gamma [Methanocorpusculum sp.]MDO9522650.1 protein translocase SEC61 complex subunit gamma [Methanocorpusculum sp.]
MAKNEKKTDEKKTLPSIQIKKPVITKASVSEFFRKYLRVLKLARRPTKDEFWKISAVAAAGIALIGVLGFLIYLIFEYLLP